MKLLPIILLGGVLVMGLSVTKSQASLPIRSAAKGAAPAPLGALAKQPKTDSFWARAKQESQRLEGAPKLQPAHYMLWGIRRQDEPRVLPKEPVIALTFDDGPHPKFTPRLLAILKKYDVKATFFVVGAMARKYPYLMQEEEAAGHLIGNHTYHHVNLNKITREAIFLEWQGCQLTIESILGEKMSYCRPPGGDFDKVVIHAARDCGLTTVLWTDDPGDYARPGVELIKRRVLNRASPGGIILLHDGIEQTLQALPEIIERLQARGYRFVTVAELQAELQRHGAAK